MCDATAPPTRAWETPRPLWSLLYGLAVLTVSALAAAEIVPLPGAWHAVLRGGLALGGFAAMAWWVRSNRAALDQQDWCACAAKKITVRVIPARRATPAPVDPVAPRLQQRPAEHEVRHREVDHETADVHERGHERRRRARGVEAGAP